MPCEQAKACTEMVRNKTSYIQTFDTDTDHKKEHLQFKLKPMNNSPVLADDKHRSGRIFDDQ